MIEKFEVGKKYTNSIFGKEVIIECVAVSEDGTAIGRYKD